MEGNNSLPVLSDRKKTILFSAIDNYIKQASPITSLLVQQTQLHDISTATIRNELSTLEAMGFLKQLHTSSGRVPTSQGYRFFVNEILKTTPNNPKALKQVKEQMFARTNNLSEIVDTIAKTISNTTNYPTVVMLDGFDNLIVSSIQILFMISGQVLVLIQTNVGAISNTILAPSNITKQDCDNASKIFTDIFAGKSVKFLTQNMNDFNQSIQNSMKNYEEVFKLVLSVLASYQNNTNSNVSNKTLIKMLESPEITSVEKAKNILSVLDDKQSLQNVFDTTDEEGIVVKIGDENNIEKLNDCAVIQTPLILDGKKVATVGIIGPERIDYATVASVLKFVSDELKNNINKGGNDGWRKKDAHEWRKEIFFSRAI